MVLIEIIIAITAVSAIVALILITYCWHHRDDTPPHNDQIYVVTHPNNTIQQSTNITQPYVVQPAVNYPPQPQYIQPTEVPQNLSPRDAFIYNCMYNRPTPQEAYANFINAKEQEEADAKLEREFKKAQAEEKERKRQEKLDKEEQNRRRKLYDEAKIFGAETPYIYNSSLGRYT